MKEKMRNWPYYGRIVWLYSKYQLLTKGLLILVIFPIAGQSSQLILRTMGRTSLSSGDFKAVLFSVQGLGLILIGFILLVILVGTDINSFIIISGLIREKRIDLTARQVLKVSLISMKKFFRPSGLAILVYVALVIPLVGIGLTISPLEGFQIPNFITDVVFQSPVYTSLYAGALILLTLVTFRYFFFFHYLLLAGDDISLALRHASVLMRGHWKSFLKDFILYAVLLGVGGTLIFIVLVVGLALPLEIYHLSPGWTMFALLNLAELMFAAMFLWIPVLCYRVTILFYRYNEKDGLEIENAVCIAAKQLAFQEEAAVKLATKVKLFLLLLGIALFNIGISVTYDLLFDSVFSQFKKIEIVAHRGGGDLAAENTIAGLEAALHQGADWSEIDVQRTKDGHYIVNHDSDFQRVAEVAKKSSEMTLAEIKQLEVKDLFDPGRPSQRVATIEEFLDAAKGRIGLFIELKGETADSRMADDLVRLIKERDMQSEVALLSLNYSLIQYIEKNYSAMTSGYLYYFALGDIANMEGDILIMEEREATPEKVDQIHDAGKKAVVWTVNTEESIEKFVNSDIDGVITDYVRRVKDGIQVRDNRSNFEIIMDEIFL